MAFWFGGHVVALLWTVRLRSSLWHEVVWWRISHSGSHTHLGAVGQSCVLR